MSSRRSPRTRQGQMVFALATAAVYGLLSHAGIVFGLFFSLCITCAGRGALMWVACWRAARPASVPSILPRAGARK